MARADTVIVYSLQLPQNVLHSPSSIRASVDAAQVISHVIGVQNEARMTRYRPTKHPSNSLRVYT